MGTQRPVNLAWSEDRPGPPSAAPGVRLRAAARQALQQSPLQVVRGVRQFRGASGAGRHTVAPVFCPKPFLRSAEMILISIALGALVALFAIPPIVFGWISRQIIRNFEKR